MSDDEREAEVRRVVRSCQGLESTHDWHLNSLTFLLARLDAERERVAALGAGLRVAADVLRDLVLCFPAHSPSFRRGADGQNAARRLLGEG